MCIRVSICCVLRVFPILIFNALRTLYKWSLPTCFIASIPPPIQSNPSPAPALDSCLAALPLAPAAEAPSCLGSFLAGWSSKSLTCGDGFQIRDSTYTVQYSRVTKLAYFLLNKVDTFCSNIYRCQFGYSVVQCVNGKCTSHRLI